MSRSNRLIVAALVGGAVAASAAPAEAASSSLQARPADVVTSLTVGVSRLGGGGYAYRPRVTSPGPLPLVVLLHGAGGDPREFMDQFRRTADRNGYLLLAPRSAGRTWELKPPGTAGGSTDKDAATVDSALSALFARAAIDPRRVVLLGFSDGASCALSIGLANPQLFRGVIALSPGFAWRPPRIDPAQRLFIAHGRSDRILPFANVRDKIVPGLQRSGLDPHVRWFNGGHEMDRRSMAEGLAFAMGESIETPKTAR
jgi:predicted esterase